MTARFFQIQLRTSEVERARTFYASVLGDCALNVVPLHEHAVARGARPHWLGYLDVGDVEGAAASFVERGATTLRPPWVDAEGLKSAVMRDPGGAIVALARAGPVGVAEGPEVAWYLLHTADVERAKENYGECMGWVFDVAFEIAPHGVFHPFAWEPGGSPVGSMSDIATRPGVHPHWLFFLRVAALDGAIAAVRAGGGSVVGPVTLPSGARIAVCDDPQGAAFGLQEGGQPIV